MLRNYIVSMPSSTVLYMEVSLFQRFYMYTCLQGMSNVAEEWCPVKGGGCLSELSFSRGFTT